MHSVAIQNHNKRILANATMTSHPSGNILPTNELTYWYLYLIWLTVHHHYHTLAHQLDNNKNGKTRTWITQIKINEVTVRCSLGGLCCWQRLVGGNCSSSGSSSSCNTSTEYWTIIWGSGLLQRIWFCWHIIAEIIVVIAKRIQADVIGVFPVNDGTAVFKNASTRWLTYQMK